MIDFKEKYTPGRLDVAIVGSGFCGSTLAVRLARQSDLRVGLVEGSGRFGVGTAYGTDRPEHLLNVAAAKMSAYPEEPNHFVDWLHVHRSQIADVWQGRAAHTDFLPRLVYGRYLTAQLREACAKHRTLVKFSQRAVDITPETGGFSILLETGRRLHARVCVLATGNPPPGRPAAISDSFRVSPRYLENPWQPLLGARAAGAEQVILLGSGLTAVDAALTIAANNSSARITMISRHGRLPRPHRHPLPSHLSATPFANVNEIVNAPSLRAIVRAFRSKVAEAHAAGCDWRAVVDALRPHTHILWRKLTLAERRRFLRHLRSLWETHRHRAAPAAASGLQALRASGRLEVHVGRILTIDEASPRPKVVLQAAGRPTKHIHLEADLIVNCTGPQADYRNLGDPLWANLLRRALATVDPCGLGIAVDPDGLLIDGQGNSASGLIALGSLRRSSVYESTAVPELRVQVKQVADRLLEEAQARPLAI